MTANSVITGIVAYDLQNAIDQTYIEKSSSPIDNFVSNTVEINKLFVSTPSQVLGNLIILGYVSAIESYFREIFRRLIITDELSRLNCEKKPVTYGAVLYHDNNMLPEALFEDLSFAGRHNILTSIKTFLNVNVQESALPADLSDNLNQLSEICELRHCIVHRFGKFGSKNAIALGLSKYANYFEKPIKCDFNTLQQMVAICSNTVKITNNLLFERIMNRLIVDAGRKNLTPIWTWDYETDKLLFSKYFKIFYSKLSPPSTALTAKKQYELYKTYYNSI
ncbi:hypothetical protein JAO73_19695 [Hymenobacter sp. BT523]|uniref:hypothetical protein n=1 Tax=Hymenobacter sp. BT523 TaxID=2795725 RepID=UPI0018EC1BBC|nr:hypothetical protein [Hymenobacter sp. BT523]MBJ6111255.1 hypothetical protein [Hymenobacter sp. BT523]